MDVFNKDNFNIYDISKIKEIIIELFPNVLCNIIVEYIPTKKLKHYFDYEYSKMNLIGSLIINNYVTMIDNYGHHNSFLLENDNILPSIDSFKKCILLYNNCIYAYNNYMTYMYVTNLSNKKLSLFNVECTEKFSNGVCIDISNDTIYMCGVYNNYVNMYHTDRIRFWYHSILDNPLLFSLQFKNNFLYVLTEFGVDIYSIGDWDLHNRFSHIFNGFGSVRDALLINDELFVCNHQIHIICLITGYKYTLQNVHSGRMVYNDGYLLIENEMNNRICVYVVES